jgi:hypothetical protein
VGRFGSFLAPVRVGPVRVIFRFGFDLIGRLSEVIGCFGFGPLVAVKEN